MAKREPPIVTEEQLNQLGRLAERLSAAGWRDTEAGVEIIEPGQHVAFVMGRPGRSRGTHEMFSLLVRGGFDTTFEFLDGQVRAAERRRADEVALKKRAR